MASLKGRRYLCGTCGTKYGLQAVYCAGCSKWFHARCEKLSEKTLSELIELQPLKFQCMRCCGNPFNYDESLLRLQSAQRNDLMVPGVAMEKILMRNHKNLSVENVVKCRNADDKFSKEILSRFDPSTCVPKSVKGDGNCMFNSISVAICGQECKASEIRVRTVLEMTEYQRYYLTAAGSSYLRLISPDYDDALRACTEDGTYSSAWTLHAAASVVGRQIDSIYPPINGITDKCFRILNRVFEPRRKPTSTEPIKIMWTGGDTTARCWTPDHFVPVLPASDGRDSPETIVIESSPDCSPVRMETDHASWPSLNESKLRPKRSRPGMPRFKSTPVKLKQKSESVADNSTPHLDHDGHAPLSPSSESESVVDHGGHSFHQSNQAPLSPSSKSEPVAENSGHLRQSDHAPLTTKSECESFADDSVGLRSHQTPDQAPRSPLSELISIFEDSLPVGEVTTPVNVEKVSSPRTCNKDKVPSPPLPELSSFFDNLTTEEATTSNTNISSTRPCHKVFQGPSSPFSELNSLLDVSHSTGEVTTPVANVSKLTTPGRFLTLAETIKILTSDDVYIHQHIPYGPKNNVYLLLDNEPNVRKEMKGERSEYADDCGVWDSARGTTVLNYFVENKHGEVKLVYLKNKLFCTETRKNKTSVWHPLEPQPQNVMKLRRYYTHLKAPGAKYRRRVTTLYVNETPNHIALIEYAGTHSNCIIAHGNSRNNIPYVRTEPRVLAKVGEMVKSKRPKRVYQDMIEENEVLAPRNFRQVRDKKYNDNKKRRVMHSNTVADEVLEVISMLDNNDYLQEIIHKKGKPPCIILYSEDQFNVFKRNITLKTKNGHDNVLGVDRTFNLGACFVTTVVYKNSTVVRTDTGDNPIFLGPMYLHWDGEYETYHSFFAHLKEKLDGDNNFEINIGSDQEAALTKALKSCFPTSTHVLCTKHLKDNLSRYLIDKVGCSANERKVITERTFGSNGLASSQDRFQFEERLQQLDHYFSMYPALKNYFKNHLEYNIFEYVCLPRQKGVSSKLWTNNNCESINNILKLEVNWQRQKMPGLIDKLCRVTRLQMLDLRRALYREGNYLLTGSYTKYAIPKYAWLQKSEDEKLRLFRNFILGKKTKKEERVFSTNKKYSIPCTPRTAKKPCQRKRVKSERTR